MNKFWIATVSGLLVTLVAPLAHAQAAAAAQPIELKGNVKLDKVIVEQGREKHVMVEPTVVVPGDRLVFATAYRNIGAIAVNNFVVTNPIPVGVMLAPDGVAQALVSVDGGKVWGKLVSLTVAGPGGAKRPALSSDVTHVRWTLPVLAPGATGTLTYRGIVR